MWTLLLATTLCLVSGHAMMTGVRPGDTFNAATMAAEGTADVADGDTRAQRCSLDDYVEGLTVRDLERVIERFAKSERLAVAEVLKQLYSSLYASLKNRDLEANGLTPMKLELLAMEELCGEGVPADRLSPPYQVIGLGGRAVPEPSDFAPLSPVRMMLRPPPGILVAVTPSGLGEPKLPQVALTVAPQMSLVEALRSADYKLQRMVGIASESMIKLGYSPALGCTVVRAISGVQTKQQRAWKIAVTDRHGKLVYNGVCLPQREQLTVLPRMRIGLSYVETDRPTA